MKIKLDEIKFIKESYPRGGIDNETVNAYRLNLGSLPPIQVQKEEKILIDGYHRLLAHRLGRVEKIEVDFLDIPKEQILWEATKRNSTHGRQLAIPEKKRLANIFYDTGKTQDEIGQILAVDQSTVSKWLHKKIQEQKEEMKQKVIGLYLDAKNTSKDIANVVGVSDGRVRQIVNNIKSNISNDPPESLQLYDHWYFSEPTKGGLRLSGWLFPQVIENLLYYFTEPFDVVVDPMVGGGTTIDVCVSMYRRYLAYDMKPLREDIPITEWNIREGYPSKAKNCDFIFLDPPYYKKKEREYGCSEITENKPMFLGFIQKLAEDSFKTIKKGGRVAFIYGNWVNYDNYKGSVFSPTLYRYFIDANFVCEMAIQTPLSTHQYEAHDVAYAKEHKRILTRTRDLYIFRRPE